MRIVALETSTSQGSVALWDGPRLCRCEALPAHRRTAQTLAPCLRAQLDRQGWAAAQIDLVALTRGPGSFTGLRIAVTTAKVLAYAARAQVVALNTLTVLAHQLPATAELASPLLNAQRGQWFAGLYQRGPTGDWEERTPCHIVDPDSWLAQLPPGTVITGPAAQRCVSLAPSAELSVAAADVWWPRADTVGRLALAAHQQGRHDDLWSLVPDYYRPSYAEEKRAEG